MSSGRTLGQLLFSSSSLMSLFLLFSSPPPPSSSHLSAPLSSLSQEKLTFGPRNSYTVEGLKANTEYSFSLAAISSKGIGAFTNELVQRTSQASTSRLSRIHTVFLRTPTHIPQIQILLCLFIYLFNVLCREYLGNILSSKRSHTQLVAVHFPQLPAW